MLICLLPCLSQAQWLVISSKFMIMCNVQMNGRVSMTKPQLKQHRENDLGSSLPKLDCSSAAESLWLESPWKLSWLCLRFHLFCASQAGQLLLLAAPGSFHCHLGPCYCHWLLLQPGSHLVCVGGLSASDLALSLRGSSLFLVQGVYTLVILL